MNDDPQPITHLILEVFRLNGALLASGDRLVADVGLTSARWQVLGAIDLSPAPAPVAHLARNMGLSRQAVQRLANDLAAQGLLRFLDNPHHARAKLVAMTDRGRAAFDAAMARQQPWAVATAAGVSAAELATTLHVLRTLRGNIDRAQGAATASETDDDT